MSAPPITDGLQLYCRGDIGTWQDTGASSAASVSNDPIARWNDARGYSSAGLYLWQTTSGSRPTLQTNQINGLPCVRFDGSNDFLDLSQQLLPAVRTMYGVLKIPSTSAYTIFCGDLNSLQWRMDTQKQRFVSCGVADIGFAGTAISGSTWAQVNAAWDLSAGSFRTSKSADGSVSNSNTGYKPILGVGRNYSGGGQEYYSGDMALLMFYYGIHSTGDRQSMENWITSEFGV